MFDLSKPVIWLVTNLTNQIIYMSTMYSLNFTLGWIIGISKHFMYLYRCLWIYVKYSTVIHYFINLREHKINIWIDIHNHKENLELFDTNVLLFEAYV